jgi:GR25 family glycosyltransferase involved in LPS biosynthesis
VHEPSKSTLACSVSHVRALRQVKTWGGGPVLILEDDVLLMPHFETRLMRLWRSADEFRNNSISMPHLFTMLGFMSNGLPPREVLASFPGLMGGNGEGATDSVILPSQTIGFFGYAVTAGAAAGTLRASLPLRQAMDSALHHSFTALAANNVQARRPFDPCSHLWSLCVYFTKTCMRISTYFPLCSGCSV